MKRLSYILKSSRVLYCVYFYLLSAIIKLLGRFIKHDDHLILFNSYGGKKYDDSPRCIYEQMLKEPRFNNYKLVWAFQEPRKHMVPGRATIIQADTLCYFITALKARVWITNSSMERGLDFKRRSTICFNTWHGSAIKKMGIDIHDSNMSFKSKAHVRADVMLAQSQYDVDIFSRAFQLPVSDFYITGLPRNDILANYTQLDVEKIKRKLGIDNDKTILLYAPTFREFTKGSNNEVILQVPVDLDFWQKKLGDKFVVLFRAHYEVASYMNVNSYPMFKDMSQYPNLDELMIVSDALISDYSSIFIDYSIMHKPMFCYAYDYKEYLQNRGMYLDLEKELPCTINQDESSLIDELLKLEVEESSMKYATAQFQQKYVSEFGHGAENSCDILFNKLAG